MNVKRKGGITFISVCGFSVTVSKRKAPKPPVSATLALGAFVSSFTFFLATIL
jgi:hypothetical protein